MCVLKIGLFKDRFWEVAVDEGKEKCMVRADAETPGDQLSDRRSAVDTITTLCLQKSTGDAASPRAWSGT